MSEEGKLSHLLGDFMNINMMWIMDIGLGCDRTAQSSTESNRTQKRTLKHHGLFVRLVVG